jgi:hypothetical protein
MRASRGQACCAHPNHWSREPPSSPTAGGRVGAGRQLWVSLRRASRPWHMHCATTTLNNMSMEYQAGAARAARQDSDRQKHAHGLLDVDTEQQLTGPHHQTGCADKQNHSHQNAEKYC